MKYTDLQINKQDYENLEYPNLDTKRQVIDGVIIDRVNEIFEILDTHKRSRKLFITGVLLIGMTIGMFIHYGITSYQFSHICEEDEVLIAKTFIINCK